MRWSTLEGLRDRGMMAPSLPFGDDEADEFIAVLGRVVAARAGLLSAIRPATG